MNAEQEVVCIYHANCLDGIAAAWVVWDYYRTKGENITLFPGLYGKPLPPDLKGKKVVIVDFSYKRADIEWLLANTDLTLLDHHKTAKDDLAGLVDIDMNYSGAVLAWRHFHPGVPVPTELEFVQDNDLHKFMFTHTRAWVAAAFSYPRTVEAFDELVNHRNRDELITEGKALLRNQATGIREISKSARPFSIDGVKGVVVNANYMFSADIGTLHEKDYEFVACYRDELEHRVYSLRSAKETGADVSAIAETFGGGGHTNAASFKIPFSDRRMGKSHIYLRSKGFWRRKVKALFKR